MKTGLYSFSRASFPLLLAFVMAQADIASLAGATAGAGLAPWKDRLPENPETYEVAEGRIQIKPRLKYELILSLHVLRCAEDHHQLFTNWAQQMRATLQPATLRQATNLNALVHEWQLCSLVQSYDGPDTIAGITDYLGQDKRRECYDWAVSHKDVVDRLGVPPKKFGRWYADFLNHYYRQGFGDLWVREQRQLVREQAPATAKALEQLPFPLLAFMEKHTGRKFQGTSKVIFYPSSFSRPQHAYGFEENGSKVVVYKVSKEPAEAMATAFHELLHPLLGGWRNPERMRKAVGELGNLAQFDKETQLLRGSYDYPYGCLEEILVHALGNYLCVKADVFTEAAARRYGYGPYQSAVYDAIFDHYETFPVVDDFIFDAITHIHSAGTLEQPKWVYQP